MRHNAGRHSCYNINCRNICPVHSFQCQNRNFIHILLFDYRNYEALEDALAICLETLISVLKDECNIDHQDNLLMILKGLLKGISTHGLSAFRNDKLKVRLRIENGVKCH